MAQVNVRGQAPRAGTGTGRLERSRSDRLVGGVAGGIAQHVGLSSTIVRAAFVVLSFALGFGIVVYLLTWLLAPLEVATDPVEPRKRRIRTPTPNQVLGIGLVAVGFLVLLWISGFWFGGELGWPVVLAAIGFAILWARSTDDGRGRWTLSSLGTPLGSVVTGDVSLPRVAIGSLLILAGMAVFLAANTSLAAAGNVLLAMIVAIGGAALLAGPWVWSMGRALVEERSSRVRSEARAEMAAHLHDSVLQTLALIQRAKAPREMASLARTQERELRAWLYGRVPELSGARLRDAVDSMAGRIERQHQVSVEAVVVGDADMDDRLRALVNACAEAVANAARHSGATTISVYVEVEEDTISAFIRDQGSGFDPDVVPSDRHGIADSIVGRMERRGGTAFVHSAAGAGTEVVLQLPRSPQ
ncbi:MAG TPA: PspC domain-containing protein [Candidatus Limnocylindria bacterium]|nr:PspC domain-containing protein [Candidatus Limnocylindria bacterium]